MKIDKATAYEAANELGKTMTTVALYVAVALIGFGVYSLANVWLPTWGAWVVLGAVWLLFLYIMGYLTVALEDNKKTITIVVDSNRSGTEERKAQGFEV